jgi:hypothetical protein
MEELAHMGSAAGMKKESGPTTFGIPHQKIISALLPWTCTQQKNIN